MSKPLPPVPRDVPRSVQLFLTAVRETVQIQAGMGRGSELDRAVTFRDLKKSLGTQDLGRLLVKGGQSDDDFFGDPIPPRPTGFKAFGMFNMVGLEWDRPIADWYATTEVFRFEIAPEGDQNPTFSLSAHVGSSSSGFFTDKVEPGKTFVYWIRHINRDYQAGDISSTDGTRASTSEVPVEVLKNYSKDIAEGDNFQWLRSEISMMDTINRVMQGSGLGDSALAGLLSEGSTLSDLLAEQSMAGALAEHTQSETMQLQFAKNYARLSGGVHAAINADEAFVMRIQAMESRWENDLGTIVDSKIEEFELTLASETGAIATAIRNFTVDYGGKSSTLQELSSVSAQASGRYEAQWGVKTEVAGLKGGVGFLNDGLKTSFVVDAQTFAVTGGNDGVGSHFPFVIKNGKVVMDTALMQNADIYNLLAKNVVAERIKVGTTLSSPEIRGGHIDGATLTIGSGFSVSQAGIMKAKDGLFIGDIRAKKGSLENVIIHENCEIKGTLRANNIEGDIVDRAVVVVDREQTIGPSRKFTLIEGFIEAGVIGGKEDRVLVVSGIALDHQDGGGSTSNFEVFLYLDGSLKQSFNSHNAKEEGSVTVQMGCHVPAGEARRAFKVVLQPGVNDNILVQQSAIVADVFKTGSTLTGVKGLHY